ncbi:DUF3460 family protein [Hydrogenophaga sp.]|uniref:DUF3460 family protein n=1 Tax=Hydrogenophaga sp. TaxID=1904254 RepID=UPI0035641457
MLFPTTAPAASHMSIFARPHYVSDATHFIEQLKSAKPTLEQEQRKGRSLLWDKQIDRDFQAQAQAAQVPQSPYVYQTESDHL